MEVLLARTSTRKAHRADERRRKGTSWLATAWPSEFAPWRFFHITTYDSFYSSEDVSTTKSVRRPHRSRPRPPSWPGWIRIRASSPVFPPCRCHSILRCVPAGIAGAVPCDRGKATSETFWPKTFLLTIAGLLSAPWTIFVPSELFGVRATTRGPSIARRRPHHRRPCYEQNGRQHASSSYGATVAEPSDRRAAASTKLPSTLHLSARRFCTPVSEVA